MGLKPEIEWTLKKYNTDMDVEMDPEMGLTPSPPKLTSL